MISYSIAIRTLGKAGKKYQKLLNSITKLNVQPEIIQSLYHEKEGGIS